jgi:hypothetical protein
MTRVYNLLDVVENFTRGGAGKEVLDWGLLAVVRHLAVGLYPDGNAGLTGAIQPDTAA